MKNFKSFLEEKKADSIGLLLYSSNKIFLVHPTNSTSYKFINYYDERNLKTPHLQNEKFLNSTKGQWSLPKGYPEGNEEPFETAKREFEEETGTQLNIKTFDKDLGTVKYNSGKVIKAFLVKGSGNEKFIKSNLITGSYLKGLPENDIGGWFDINSAKELMHPEQAKFLNHINN